MSVVTDAFNTWLRDYVADGVPASGPNTPAKTEGRAIGALIEAYIASQVGPLGSSIDSLNVAGLYANAEAYATVTLMNADLAHAAGTLGVVYAQAGANGTYIKSGASGTGAWTLTALLADSGVVDSLGGTAASGLGGGATFTAGAGISAPSYTIAGAAYADVGGALGAVSTQAGAVGTGAATNFGGGATYSAAGGLTAWSCTVAGTAYANVAAAITAAAGQTTSLGSAAATRLGGGATYSAAGGLTAPSYTIAGVAHASVGGAFGGVMANVAVVQASIVALDVPIWTVPGVGDCVSVTCDAQGYISACIDFGNNRWEAVGGVLVKASTAMSAAPSVVLDVPAWTVPGVGDVVALECDAGGYIYWCRDVANVEWNAVGGALIASGIAGGALTPAHALGSDSVTHDDSSPTILDIFEIKGQSLDICGNTAPTNVDHTATTAPLDPGYSLMFAPAGGGAWPAGQSGAWPDSNAVSTAAFLDLQEAHVSSGGGITPGGSYETMCSRAAHAIQDGLVAAGLPQRKMLWYTVGQSGQPFGWLALRGSPGYVESLRLLAAAVATARAAGLTPIYRGCAYGEGPADQGAGATPWQYMRYLAMWKDQWSGDVKALTSQTEPVRYWFRQEGGTSQTDGAILAWSTKKLCDLDPGRATCHTADYWGGPNDGSITGHRRSIAYLQWGEALGQVVLQDTFGTGFQPLKSVDQWPWVWTSTGSSWVGQLRFELPVTFDTSGLWIDDANLPHHGLVYGDSSGSPPSISATSLVAAGLTASVAGAVITLGGTVGGSPAVATTTMGQLGLSSRIWALAVTAANLNSGQAYGLKINPVLTIANVATAMAALIPGATASGLTITLAGGAGAVTAAVYTDTIQVTLSGAPGPSPYLTVASTYGGLEGNLGPFLGVRSTIRTPAPFALSAVQFLRASFGANPTAGQAITVAGVTITFVTGAPSGAQAQIGATALLTVANLLAYLQSGANSALLPYWFDQPGGPATLGGAIAFPYLDCYSIVGQPTLTVSTTSGAISFSSAAPVPIPLYEWALEERIELPYA